MSAGDQLSAPSGESPKVERGGPSGEPTGVRGQASLVTRQELSAWGEELGRGLRTGNLVSISGELGSGKTTLAQAICRGVGVRGDVTSPTFALVNQYEAERATVYHLDLYRLHGPGDLTNLGWDDIVNSDSIVLVEWPERAGQRLPADAIQVRLEHVPGDESHRRLIVA